MKKKTNKFIVLIVTAACIFTCMLAPAQPAYGAGEEGNTKSDKIASEIADQFSDPSNGSSMKVQKNCSHSRTAELQNARSSVRNSPAEPI